MRKIDQRRDGTGSTISSAARSPDWGWEKLGTGPCLSTLGNDSEGSRVRQQPNYAQNTNHPSWRGRLKLMIKAPTDAVLVTKSVAGDKDSYRTLVERYQQRVFAIAFDIVRVREDAEDIAQEAFVKAFISLADFKGQSSFYTWLYRIVHNMAIDYRRRVSRRGGAPAEFNEQLHAVEGVESSGHFDSPDQAIMRKEQAVSINAVLAELSEEHRIVVTLREIDGLSYDEIADVLGISRGTVMSRLHYGRKRLQAALVERGMRDAVVPNPDQVSEQQLSGLR